MITLRFETTSTRRGFQPPEPEEAVYSSHESAADSMRLRGLNVPMQGVGEERGPLRWGRTERAITTTITVVEGDRAEFDAAMWRVADLSRLGRALTDARRTADLLLEQAEEFGLLAVRAGQAESHTARSLGVDRMTVRKWQGKR